MFASVANPKFAFPWSRSLSEFQIPACAGKLLKSKVVLDLNALDADTTQNSRDVISATLAFISPAFAAASTASKYDGLGLGTALRQIVQTRTFT